MNLLLWQFQIFCHFPLSFSIAFVSSFCFESQRDRTLFDKSDFGQFGLCSDPKMAWHVVTFTHFRADLEREGGKLKKPRSFLTLFCQTEIRFILRGRDYVSLENFRPKLRSFDLNWVLNRVFCLTLQLKSLQAFMF